MNNQEQAAVNPIESQREQALKHYEEASAAIYHWSSFVENAIKAYNPTTPLPSQQEAGQAVEDAAREFADRPEHREVYVSIEECFIAGSKWQQEQGGEWKGKRVTLCGSTKFKIEFDAINKQLTLEGNIVYSVCAFGHADNIKWTDEQKRLLDEVHKRKIDNSDAIFVIDVDGYIGDSTRSEIEYAERTGKIVKYLSSFPDLKMICDYATLSQSPPLSATGQDEMVSIEELYDYGEWARANGEQHRGNLQKNRKQLYEYYLKNKAAWKRTQY